MEEQYQNHAYGTTLSMDHYLMYSTVNPATGVVSTPVPVPVPPVSNDDAGTLLIIAVAVLLLWRYNQNRKDPDYDDRPDR